MKSVILSNNEILNRLKKILNVESSSDLARLLGTERQNLKSFEQKETVDLNNRIISLLVKLIEER